MLYYGGAAVFCLIGVVTGAFAGNSLVIYIIVLVVMALFNIAIHMAGPVMVAWLNSIVGQKGWAGFFSTRMIAGDIAVLLTSLAVGAYLGASPSTNTFVSCFAVACLIGLIGVYCLHRTPDPNITDSFPDLKGYFKKIIEAMRRPEIRGLMLITFIRSFAYGFIVPFQPLFLLESLGLKYTQISYLLAIGTVFSIIFYKVWAHVQRKLGFYPSLKWNFAFFASEPFFWLFSRPGNHVPVYFAYILFGFNGWGGAVNAGYWTSLVGSFFKNSEEHQKPIYMAMYYLVYGIAFISAPLISGGVIHNFSRFSHMLPGLLSVSLDKFRFIFMIAGVLGIIAALYAVIGKSLRNK